jgi:hypothetical protein
MVLHIASFSAVTSSTTAGEANQVPVLYQMIICTDRKPKNTSHNSTVANTYV